MGGYTLARCARCTRRTAGDRTPPTAHTQVMSDPLDWAVRDQPLGARPAPVNDPNAAYPPAYGPPPARPPRRRRTGLVVGLVIGLVLILGAAGVGAYLLVGRSADTFDANMTLTVPGCASPGYDDIHQGTQATLTDAHNTVVSVAELDVIGTCHWRATFHKVPAGQSFYGITIGRRGALQFTEAELRQGAALSIG